MFAKLKGKKTYVTAVVAIVSAVGAYLVGETGLQDTVQIVVGAVFAATLRDGMNTAAGR